EQVAVEVGRVGTHVAQLAQEQPLAGEVLDERLGPWIGKHAADLAFEDSLVPELAPHRRLAQLVVGNAAPQEERQPRRQLEIGQPKRRPGRGVGRLAFEAEEELRIDEDAREPALNAGLERSATPSVAE